jgi:hypothetical protein
MIACALICSAALQAVPRDPREPIVVPEPRTPWRIEPFFTYMHASDLFRGAPFNDTDEFTADYIGFGFTFEHGKVELDISHGRKGFDCACVNEAGTQLAVRFYPWRR